MTGRVVSWADDSAQPVATLVETKRDASSGGGKQQEDEARGGAKEEPGAEALRDFHNWIKQQLYTAHVFLGQCVLELGSGKGGDLLKAHACGAGRVINLDVSQEHLDLARTRAERSLGRRDPEFLRRLSWHRVDLTDRAALAEVCVRDRVAWRPGSVDVVSAQFSIAHFFRSAECVRELLAWVATLLVDGGFFMGTCADADLVVRQLRLAAPADSAETDPALVGGTLRSPILQLELDPLLPIEGKKQTAAKGDSATMATFGRGLRMALSKSATAQNVQEFCVHWPTLAQMARACGLLLVDSRPFGEWAGRYDRANLSADELQASLINRSFVFQKTSR